MMSEAHCNNLPQRKALGLVTHDNTGGPFVVECQGCGEVYPSFHCLGGGQIADTGDYEDARCPHCDQVEPEECDNAGLAWNTQQLKINTLQERLTDTDQRADDLQTQIDELEHRHRAEFEASQAAERRVEVLEGLLRRVVASSVLSFERDAPEELEGLEVDICAALKPTAEGCVHEFIPFTKGCSKCDEPYATEGASHE